MLERVSNLHEKSTEGDIIMTVLVTRCHCCSVIISVGTVHQVSPIIGKQLRCTNANFTAGPTS